MQEEHLSIFGVEEQPVSLRTQQLMQHLDHLWKHPYKPSPETLNRVIEVLVQLPESYKNLGMTKIAEYLVNVLSLHFLDIIAIFQQKAEGEGIGEEECKQTLHGAIIEKFSEMMGISKHVIIRSIDDLVTLSNITLSLQTLSQVNSAEEAQNWMYDLPELYYRQLKQEHLIANLQIQATVSRSATKVNTSGYISWNNSSLPRPIDLPPIVYGTPTIA